jgi:uncharacterized membrane protein YphA (DoxX/SURF4 family)
MNSYLQTITAILITLIYFQSVFSKNLSSTPKGLQEHFIKALPIFFYKIVIIGVIILEFLAPLIIVYSTINKRYREYGKYSTLALIIFTIMATVLYHIPFSKSFYSHLSIIGGLIALYFIL